MPSATQEQKDAINAKILQDPEFQRLQQEALAAGQYDAKGQQDIGAIMLASGRLSAYMKAHGLDAHDWEFNDKTGQFDTKKGFFARNPWAVALLAGGGALGGAVATAGLGAAGGAGAAGAAGAGGAATTGTTAATTAATAAGGSSLLHSMLPSLIGAGSNVAGTVIAAKAQSDAAKKQQEQDDKALAIQQQQYALQRQDTAPYRSLGLGAVGNLGYLAGIDVDSRVPELSSTVPKTAPPPLPTKPTMPNQTLSTLGAPSTPAGGSGLVSMRNPQTGLVHLVPQDQVAAAQSAGGVLA